MENLSRTGPSDKATVDALTAQVRRPDRPISAAQAATSAAQQQGAALKAQIAAAAKLAQTVQTAVTNVQRPLTELKAAQK